MIDREKIDRSWGYYEIIEDGGEFYNPYKIKNLVVFPSRCLSLQRHGKRNEFWLVKHGKGTMIIKEGDGLKAYELFPGDHYIIPVGAWHQLINGTSEVLEIHEIQYGPECNEEDIERK